MFNNFVIMAENHPRVSSVRNDLITLRVHRRNCVIAGIIHAFTGTATTGIIRALTATIVLNWSTPSVDRYVMTGVIHGFTNTIAF